MSAFPVVDAQDPNTDLSAFGRCVAELTLAPSFFLDAERITWETAQKDSATFTVRDHGLSARAEMFVNADGSLDRIEVVRNFDRGKGKSTPERFVAKGVKPMTYSGYRIASKLVGWWDLKEGRLEYVRFIVDSAEFR